MAGPVIHTKLANSHIPPEGLFWGSVTHYLLLAINGAYSRAVAAIGAVQMIIAGSPCQGFSKKQLSKYSEASMRNASMIAILISFLDLYRPEYALFENVNGMAGAYGASRDEFPFDQILCAIVGMGYQVQVWHANAENYGACQSRKRVFVSVAAPGLQPLRPLAATHTSFTNRQHRGLGRTANNELYGVTEEVEAPHDFISAGKGTAHLPTLHTPQTAICVQDPDHRASNALNPGWQRIMRFIPRYPPGCGLEQTMRQGLLSVQMLDDAMPQGGKRNTTLGRAFRRVIADKPFDTIVTKADPRDTRGTQAVHWDRDGLMTIAEARCGQGIPESDVLIGNPAQQWKIVGNAVARGPAIMLGINLREAWIKSNERFAETDLLACSAPVELPSVPALSYKELNKMATKSSCRSNTHGRGPSPVRLHDSASTVKPISIRPGLSRSNFVVAIPNRTTVIPPTVVAVGTEADDLVDNASVGAITGDSVDVAARPSHDVSAGASMDDPMDASIDSSTDASMDVPMDASMRAPTHALTDASIHALADASIKASVHATANARYYSSLAPSEDDKSRDNIVTASGVTTQEGLDVSEAIPRDDFECGSNADGITIDVGPQAEMLDQQLANNEDAFSEEKDLANGNSVAMDEVVDIADRLPRTASSDISDDPDVIPCTATSVNRYIMPGDRPQSIYDTQMTPPIGTRYITPEAPEAARDHVIPVPASTVQHLRLAERPCVVILSQSSSSDEDNAADMETNSSPSTSIDKSTSTCNSSLERTKAQITAANDLRKLVKVRLATRVRAANIKAKEAMKCVERAEAQKKARAARVREAARARAAKRVSVTVLGSSLACPSDEIAWQAFDAFDWDWHPYPSLSDSLRRKCEATDKRWAMSPSQKAWATRRARALERARTVKKPVDDASPLPRRSSSEEEVKKEEGDVPEWQTSHDQKSNDTASTTANLETTRSHSRAVTIPGDIRLANANRKAKAATWAARSLAQKEAWIKRRARASRQAQAAKQAGDDASPSSWPRSGEYATKEEEQDDANEWQTFCNPRSGDNEPPTTEITTTTSRGGGRVRKGSPGGRPKKEYTTTPAAPAKLTT